MKLTKLERLALSFLESECDNECSCDDCGASEFCGELCVYFEKNGLRNCDEVDIQCDDNMEVE
jgi:positive regulator of sigma E activity